MFILKNCLNIYHIKKKYFTTIVACWGHIVSTRLHNKLNNYSLNSKSNANKFKLLFIGILYYYYEVGFFLNAYNCNNFFLVLRKCLVNFLLARCHDL